MDYPFDVELLSAQHKYRHDGAFSTALSPQEGRFLLVYVASGLTRGVLRLADGQIAFEASGGLYDGAMVLVPHGAVLETTFDEISTEACVYEFACPAPWLQFGVLLHAVHPPGDRQDAPRHSCLGQMTKAKGAEEL